MTVLREPSRPLDDLTADGLRAEYVRWHAARASGVKSAGARLVLVELNAKKRGIDLGASHAEIATG